MELLKINYAIASNHIKEVKRRERKHLEQARGLKGKFPTKHQLDMPPKQPTTAMEKAHAWALTKPEEALTAAEREYIAFWGLERYRKNILRKYARSLHLAINFLRGHDFEEVETRNYTDPNFDEIERLVFFNLDDTLDPRDVKQRFEEWVQTGTRHKRKR